MGVSWSQHLADIKLQQLLLSLIISPHSVQQLSVITMAPFFTSCHLTQSLVSKMKELSSMKTGSYLNVGGECDCYYITEGKHTYALKDLSSTLQEYVQLNNGKEFLSTVITQDEHCLSVQKLHLHDICFIYVFLMCYSGHLY